ncbi:response regulator [Pedobacter sp. MC2016-24]|uniref:response regulator n=1 Tax=Pedobacter sp. MC2016-24 TaxID=2780090 RepID=UPI001882B719|nr:response regulator [Pedobacter sp. MC2016-24]MBE9599387.1 response regulator [Pedobacter sp. MC2016-24]
MANKTKKIIIFDDDQDILSICQFVLEDKGWEVSVFTDCRDIEERVASINPDVILMDNWIPVDGGIVATNTLKASEHLKHIPVIYFSANSDIERLAREARADGFLSKPFELDDLEQKVTSALG